MRQTTVQPGQNILPRLLAGYLFESPIGDDTAPVIRVLDLIHLQTNARVGTQRIELFTRQRVDVNVFAIEEVIHRHDVWPARGNTAEPSQSPFAQDRQRIRVFQPADIHLLIPPVRYDVGLRTISAEQGACDATACDTEPSMNRVNPR